MKIVIAGYGFVGRAVENALKRHSKIQLLIDDPALGSTNEETDVDGVVVCVATPAREDGTCDTTHVNEVFTKYGGTK